MFYPELSTFPGNGILAANFYQQPETFSGFWQVAVSAGDAIRFREPHQMHKGRRRMHGLRCVYGAAYLIRPYLLRLPLGRHLPRPSTCLRRNHPRTAAPTTPLRAP